MLGSIYMLVCLALLGVIVLIVAICVALFFFEGRWVVSQENVRKCQKRILRGTNRHTIIAGT
jgi:hypothetical protein